MYLLIDLNQLLIAQLIQSIQNKNLVVPDENGNMVKFKDAVNEKLIRHMCINTIRAQIKNFKSKYPNIIIACDNRYYWRREFFPYYKSHRKNDRDESGLDWNMIFSALNTIKDELKKFFPYKVLDVTGAEADDVIAVLSKKLSQDGEVLILSSDKDFGQLQVNSNILQYAPAMKRFIRINDPVYMLREHIIKGDRGDGIPNILSPDHCLALKERQKPISSKKLTEWCSIADYEKFCTTDNMLRGYKRNQVLIDFEYIPEKIQSAIIESYENYIPATKQEMLSYFMDKGLRVMIENVHDF